MSSCMGKGTDRELCTPDEGQRDLIGGGDHLLGELDDLRQHAVERLLGQDNPR
jgi:hypothetical protein